MAEGVPTTQVTMLGGTGSGKTTYLVGMYAELSAGIDNYYLGSDQDTDVDLTNAWSALIEDGILPVATGESRPFEFMFRYGADPLLALTWLDYRGGAMRDRTDAPGTAELLTRLGESDSLYLTLDGGLLAAVLDGESMAERRLRDLVGRYSTILSRVVDERRAKQLYSPSIVVLVTKGDLLRGHLQGSLQEQQSRMRDWAVDLFGLAFRPDWDSAVCVVSLGSIGRPTDARVDPSAVNPMRIHKPMIFSLYSFYRRAAISFRNEATRASSERSQGTNQLDELRAKPVARFVSRKRLREMVESVQRMNEYVAMMESLANECLHRTQVLEGELLDVATYIDGRWMDGTE